MAITTTTVWGRALTDQEITLMQAQLAELSVAEGSALDFTSEPEIIIWADVDSAIAWQAWIKSGSITPQPVNTEISFP